MQLALIKRDDPLLIGTLTVSLLILIASLFYYYTNHLMMRDHFMALCASASDLRKKDENLQTNREYGRKS